MKDPIINADLDAISFQPMLLGAFEWELTERLSVKGPSVRPDESTNLRYICSEGRNQTRDFIYVDDIIEAIIRSADSSFEGIVNVESGVFFYESQG